MTLIHMTTAGIRYTTGMPGKYAEGAVSIIALGVGVLVLLGGALLIATHEPGNPPFSFTNPGSDAPRPEEKSSPPAPADAAETPPVSQKKTTVRKPLPKAETKKSASAPVSLPTQASAEADLRRGAPPERRYPSWRPGCVSDITPRFTHAFTDLSAINAINPIGGIGGGSPARSYIGVKDGMEAAVYAPMDAVLRVIIYADRGSGQGEYGLIFRATCEVEFMFDHIDRISDALAPYAPKVAAASSQFQDNTELNVRVQAGDLLGYTDGTPLARTFDFLVTNYAKKNKFLNPARWEWEQALYGTCPYDHFTDDLKKQYYAKLGKPGHTGFIPANACGNPAHDVAGTASGGWFRGASTDKRGEYLAIARQYDEAQVAYRKDGLAFPDTQSVQQGKPYLNVMDMSPDKYPADITPGMAACYSGNNQWAYIKLVSATELLMASGTGECPSVFPESQATAWMR